MYKPYNSKWEGQLTGNPVIVLQKIDSDTYEIQFQNEIKKVSESRLKLANRRKKIRKKY